MTIGYVGMRDRLLICEGTAPTSTWDSTAVLDGAAIECVAASPDRPDRVFVGTFENGLVRSADGGETFEQLELGPEGDAVTAVAVSPHDPSVVYAGTEPSRAYRSTDGGDTWTRLEGLTDLPSEPEWFFPPRPHTHHVRWIEVDPFDPDRLYVGIEAGAFVLSTDGGGSWRERPPGSRRDNHSLATHADREGLVYSAAGDGFAESRDGGESWEHPQDGLDHRYCWSVVADSGDPDAVLVSSARGASSAHIPSRADSHVYRKRGDDRWARLDGRGLPSGEGVVRTVFATAGENGVVYGVNNRGLFASEDFGDRWERVPIEWPEGLETQAPRGLAVVAG